jgi:hypothetical protein
LLRVLIDEDNLLRSIDNYKMKITQNLMQQTELIRRKEDKTIDEIKKKVQVFDRPRPKIQMKERIIQKKNGINWFLIVIGAVLVIFLSRLI